MKVAAIEKECGLEHPDGTRVKPDKHGLIDWPDRLSDYAEAAGKTDRFVIPGRQYGGYGPGKLPKPYRVAIDG